MRRDQLAWITGCLALVAGPALAVAEDAAPPAAPAASDEGDVSDLQGILEEPILSTPSKSLEAASAAPATSTSVSAEDLRRYGIRSLDEAINFLSLGMITQNPLHSVDVGARGVLLTSDFGNHVLLLVDGHSMNEQWDGTAYFERGAAIPFEMVDHIEIILGPGSVLYGSNAMLGVINIVTKRAKDWGGYHLVAESELATSWRAAAGVGKEFSLFGKPGELTLGLEYYWQSGPAFTFGPQKVGDDSVTMMPKKFDPAGTNAGTWGGTADKSYWTRIPAAYMRASVGRLELGIHAASYKRGTPYVNQFNITSGDFNDPGNYELDRWLSADLRHSLTLSSIAELRSRLYGDLYQYNQHANVSAPEDCADMQLDGCKRDVVGLSRWTGLEEQLALDWTRDGSFATLLGADGRVRYAGSQLDIVDTKTGANPGSVGKTYKTEGGIGVFLQQAVSPVRWLDGSAGARLDADSRYGTHLSPRAALAFRPWTGGTIKGIYAEAFRAPTLYELYFADTNSQVPANQLRPEVVRSVEGLVEQRVGTHRLLVGAFRSWWSDIVTLDALTDDQVAQAIKSGALSAGAMSAVQYRNTDGISDYGVNAAFEGSEHQGAFRYGLNLTVAKAQREQSDGTKVDLTVTPKVFGNARVSYALPGGLPTIGVAAVLFGRRLADRANDGMFLPTPYAPTQFEVRGTLTGAVPWVRGLSYRVTADVAAAGRNPYVAGPLQAATPDHPAAELSPVDQFRVGVGLQYDFGASHRAPAP